ncbi:MAG: hypothetical protein Q8Q63_12790 [Phaeovulum sp.]|uniref:hypothetical protein n=1 Tax=Phaeovulum sp. TaxID=2934796 RepID=UPI002735F594|nr:hypothetical protein [Phaeovulum sp.]MDP3862449.1 hypothetical protein [Phaeovulum sp.]
MQIDPVVRARREALREAQSWLLVRAREMNDPHARQVLNSAASAWGNEKLRGFDRTTGRARHPEALAIRPDAEPTPSGGAAHGAGEEG